METKLAPYLDRFRELRNQRRGWTSGWKEIDENILPGRGMFVLDEADQPNSGEQKHGKIVDSTASYAMRTLTSGMQGGLTSPARPWFRLKLQDEELAEYGPVREWLHTVEKVLYSTFSQSNFYTSIHDTYWDECGFGTSLIYQEPDPLHDVLFYNMAMGTFYLATNNRGEVDTIYRLFWMSAYQMARQFGKENCSQVVKETLKGTPEKHFKVMHLVQPNDSRNPNYNDNKNMQFESVWFEFSNHEDKNVLHRSGFHENPFTASRWLVRGSEVYGRSPGWEVLPDVKYLHSMAASRAKSVHLANEPPMLIPGSFKKRLRLQPADQNWVGRNAEQIKSAFDGSMRPDIQAVTFLVQDTREQVEKGLFNDLFLSMMPNRHPQMTATEVVERSEEKLLLLGPVIERQFFEKLDPIIKKTYSILENRGKIPPMDPEMERQEGGKMSIEYISLLAQAQKLVGTQSINAFTGFAGQVAQVQAGTGQPPECLDKIRFDEVLDQYADATGVPPKIIVPDDEIIEIRANRAEQAAQAQKGAELQQGIESAKTLSETQMGDENALSKLNQMMEGG